MANWSLNKLIQHKHPNISMVRNYHRGIFVFNSISRTSGENEGDHDMKAFKSIADTAVAGLSIMEVTSLI